MNRADYIEHLRAILCLDSIINKLSIADRYWLHREIILNAVNILEPAIVNETQGYILTLSQHIVKTNWKRPELKYNEARELIVYSPNKFCWKPFKPQDYV